MQVTLRTGGVHTELYPSEQESADSIRCASERDVAFKATAGLHHAVRNTGLATGFEQHGFRSLTPAAAARAAAAEVRLRRRPVSRAGRRGFAAPSLTRS